MTTMIALKHVDKAAMARVTELVGQDPRLSDIWLLLIQAPEYDPYNQALAEIERLKKEIGNE